MTPSLDELLEQATVSTGLDDFGSHVDFLAGLRVLLAAMAESELSMEQQSALTGRWVGYLETRLRLVAHRQSHPADTLESIQGPLVVTGLPRTGTTALVELLALDPAARAPMQWEISNLFPPADKAEWSSDPRIAAVTQDLDLAAATNPIVQLGLHTYGALLPDECNTFMVLDFWGANLSALPFPRYRHWLRFHTPRLPYRTHRWVLQHLQGHGPDGRWTLKSPFHIFAVPELLDEYPDAMVIQTHRDPTKTASSLCGLFCAARGLAPGDPRRPSFAREVLRLWATGLERFLAARQDPSVEARILDVTQIALMRDPLGTLRQIYERFDLPLSGEAENAMKAWVTSPTQHISATHFTLEEFGLDDDMVTPYFEAYLDRFASQF